MYFSVKYEYRTNKPFLALPPLQRKSLVRRQEDEALLFSNRQKLAFVREGNNKASSHPPIGGWQGFFFVKHPPEDHATAGSVILHVFAPKPPKEGFNLSYIIT